MRTVLFAKRRSENCRSFKQPSTLLEAWCRSSGMIVSHTWQGECRFHHSDWYSDVWINFWPLQKLKISHVLSSRILIREKGRLGVTIQNGGKTNFEMKFVGYPTKNVALKSFWLLVFGFFARETACGPKKHCFWDGMNLSHWVYVGFLWH